MLSIKQIHRRKFKKFYGYFFLCFGLFCIVLSLCFGEFLILESPKQVVSPLGIISHGKTEANTSIVAISQACDKFQLSCENISKQSENEATFSVDNKKIIISLTKNIEQEIASLQVLIKQLTMEGKEFHTVDFRFDKPVISQ